MLTKLYDKQSMIKKKGGEGSSKLTGVNNIRYNKYKKCLGKYRSENQSFQYYSIVVEKWRDCVSACLRWCLDDRLYVIDTSAVRHPLQHPLKAITPICVHVSGTNFSRVYRSSARIVSNDGV